MAPSATNEPAQIRFLPIRSSEQIRFDILDSPNFEAEYNNRERVPEFGAISARWQAASDAYREIARAELNQPYGPSERHRYDMYFGGSDKLPTVVFVHGGYWQRGDRTTYGFIARDLNSEDINVVIPSYSLCPGVSVMDIIGEIRLCLVAIWERTGTYPLLVGHSAGGHLTSAMLATDWSAVPGAPSDLVRAGISISGIFDLQPLIGTSINEGLKLDIEAARAASPRFWSAPPNGRMLIAAVGANESGEFLRQSRDIVQHWGQAGTPPKSLRFPARIISP